MRWRKASDDSPREGSGRDVAIAVRRLVTLDFDHTGPDPLDNLVAAWSASRGRSVQVENSQLPLGVFGLWVSLPDRDVIRLAPGATREHTLAHEIGHIAMGHEGQTVTEWASVHLGDHPDLVRHLLARGSSGAFSTADGCGAGDPRQEAEAEAFAARLLAQLRLMTLGHDPRIDAIFG